MTHPYHSIGAKQDRAKTWSYLSRIADALERIAHALETEPLDEPIIPRLHPSVVHPFQEQQEEE